MANVVKIISKIKNVSDAIEKAHTKAVTMAAIEVHKQATINATPSVDTGRLRASISYSIDGNQSKGFKPVKASKPNDWNIKSGKFYGIVGSNVAYARRLEYGWSSRMPDGYLRKAWDSTRETRKKIFKDVMSEAIYKAAIKL